MWMKVVALGGKLYAIGGIDNTISLATYLQTVEVYDPSEG